jgi:hypothetical protein
MNVEIGAEAAQFQEKEYINGIAFAVLNTFRLSAPCTGVGRSFIQYPGIWLILRLNFWME